MSKINKVQTVEKPKTFNPIEISITLETLEEARAFYCLFNNGRMSKYMQNEVGINHFEMRQALREENEYLYNSFNSKLDSMIRNSH